MITFTYFEFNCTCIGLIVLIGILMAVCNASGYAKGMDDGAEAAMDAVRKHFILSPKMRELVDR